ncbi:hypothetical protein LL912_15770 [Niabella sp. CC-SYL272]|uniref:hypothetical protein n=1 Tax=Niabella agricola TaxID=2891571 RepID=UPI001F175D30|nr:hypothetical protein [Niabella agricola]MCF3110242.1 hypothetical protein [Niabella agricola]
MWKIAAFICMATLLACGKAEIKKAETNAAEANDSRCGSYNGHLLYRGKNGGCYYINSKGNKTYVDSYHCSCY